MRFNTKKQDRLLRKRWLCDGHYAQCFLYLKALRILNTAHFVPPLQMSYVMP